MLNLYFDFIFACFVWPKACDRKETEIDSN